MTPTGTPTAAVAETPTREATPTPEPTPTPVVGAVGETLSNDVVAVTLNSVDPAFVSPNRYSQPDAGHHFVVVDVTIEAVGSEAVHYNPLDFEIGDPEGYRYDREGVVGAEPDLSFGELRSGEKIRGRIAFQIPDGVTGLELLYAPTLGRVVGRWDLGI